MPLTFETRNPFAATNVRAALLFARTSLDYTERLVQLNLKVASDLIHENKAGAEKLLQQRTPDVGDWLSVYQESAKKAVEIGQRYFHELAETQKEIAQNVGEQITAIQETVKENFETAASAVNRAVEDARIAGQRSLEKAGQAGEDLAQGVKDAAKSAGR